MTKDCVIALRCDQEAKDFFMNLADARNVTVSKLLFGLISEGSKLEQERRSQIKKLASIVVSKGK